MKIALYYAPTTCALVPYVNLTEAGADFEVRVVNFFKAKHMSPEFLRINPMHKVPVLDVDGTLLKENVALQIFIARQFPGAKLLPADPIAELKAISLMSWFGSGIHPFLARVNNPAKVCDAPNSAAGVRAAAAEILAENFTVVDSMLAGREFFFDHYTAPDAYFFWCFRRASQFELPLSGFKNANAHFERMQQRPSFKKVLAFEAETIARLKAEG